MERPSLPGEEWKPVVGYEGLYEVSSLGRVWSCGRTVPHIHGCVRRIPPRILRPLVVRGGPNRLVRYVSINLYDKEGVVLRPSTVHSLVIRAFVGPKPFDGAECCHGDGDPMNNSPKNLRWDTHAANCVDIAKHGTRKRVRARYTRGEARPNALLTEEAIRCIRAEPYFKGVGVMLGLAFGVDKATICSVRRGRSWTHVPQYL